MRFPSSSGDLVGSWGMLFLTFCTATRNDSLWLPSRLVGKLTEGWTDFALKDVNMI